MEPCDKPGPWHRKMGAGGSAERPTDVRCNRPRGHKGHHAFSTDLSSRLLEWTSRGAVYPADRAKEIKRDGATYSL